MGAEFTKRTKAEKYPPDSSRGAVELGNFMFCDSLPVAGGSGVYGGGLEDGSSHAVEKRPVDDIAVGER